MTKVAFETKFNLFMTDGSVVHKSNGATSHYRTWFVEGSVVKYRHADRSIVFAPAAVTIAWREWYLPQLIVEDSP